jgi:hypothetical protein
MNIMLSLILSALLTLSFTVENPQEGGYAIQVEATQDRSIAEQKVRQLKEQGLEAYWVEGDVPGKGVYYRVRIGQLPNKEAATNFGASLKRQGIAPDFLLVTYQAPDPAIEARPSQSQSTRQDKRDNSSPGENSRIQAQVSDIPAGKSSVDERAKAGLAVNQPSNTAPVQPNPAQNKPAKEVMTNATVIELVKLGFSESVIIEKMRRSERNFDTSLEGLKQLKTAQVSEAIIKEMLNPQTAAAIPPTPSPAIAAESAAAKPAAARDSAGRAYPLPPDAGAYLWDGKQLHLLYQSKASSMGSNFFRSITPFVKKKLEIQLVGAYAKAAFDHNQPTILVSGLGAVTPGIPSYRLLYVKTGGMLKDRRIVGTYDIGGFFGSVQEVDNEIECQIKKVGDGIYAITPVKPLPDGEYGITQMASTAVIIWDFGIYAEGRPAGKSK